MASANRNRKLLRSRSSSSTSDSLVGQDDDPVVSIFSGIIEFVPGKKGGEFALPSGGKVRVPGSAVATKEAMTLSKVPPYDRHSLLPELKRHEGLISEVFVLSSRVQQLSKPVSLQIPIYELNRDTNNLFVRTKASGSTEWATLDFTITEDEDGVEVLTDRPGTFVVTTAPKAEEFEVTPSGCLYNSKMCRNLSVRFPKKCIDENIECDIQITPCFNERMQELRKMPYTIEIGDILAASDFVQLSTSHPGNFRRSVTLKLPLPDNGEDEMPQEDVGVLCDNGDGWELMDTSLKFTKTTVAFEVRHFSKYCVALARPKRKQCMVDGLLSLEGGIASLQGELLAFLHMEPKEWTVIVECVDKKTENDAVAKRVAAGYKQLKKVDLTTKSGKSKNTDDSQYMKRNYQLDSEEREEVFNLQDKCVFDFGMEKDIKIATVVPSIEDLGRVSKNIFSSANNILQLTYHSRLPENYRKVSIAPRSTHTLNHMLTVGQSNGRLQTESAALTQSKIGSISLFKEGEGKQLTRKALRMFTFDITEEQIAEYFYEEKEEEPEVEPEEEVEDIPEEAPAPALTPSREKEKDLRMESFLRLTTPKRPVKKFSRESKVLTGRSLMSLAREVEQGLTLAVYLDISDSTITGIGFDALSSGQGLIDVTYKILLHWKRMCGRRSFHGEAQVKQLVFALDSMGRQDVAQVIWRRHKQNKEITHDCFQGYQHET